MKVWYDLNEDGSINRSVHNEAYAAQCGLTLTSEREIVYGYDGKKYFSGDEPVRPVTVDDYDRAMEDHLKKEQTDRGYTTRSPSEYANSTNVRWKQDAADWIAHVTTVMEYALDIENKHERGEQVPTLDEFKAALPDIVWTYSV